MNVDLGLFVLRVVVGAVVAAHGLQKLGYLGGYGLGATAGFFQSIGFRPPRFWALVAALAESGGGILMVLGLGGPIGPGIVAADMLVVTLVAHLPKGFWAQNGGIEFPLPLAAGAFAVALIGAGAWSIDRALGITYPEWLGIGWAALMVIGVVGALGVRLISAPRQASQTS